MNELEAIYAIGACLFVFAVSMFGVMIYALRKMKNDQAEKDLEIDLKMKVVIESVIEIFESKYRLYDEDDNKGGIGPGA